MAFICIGDMVLNKLLNPNCTKYTNLDQLTKLDRLVIKETEMQLNELQSSSIPARHFFRLREDLGTVKKET